MTQRSASRGLLYSTPPTSDETEESEKSAPEVDDSANEATADD